MKWINFNFFQQNTKETVPSDLFKLWTKRVPNEPAHNLQHLIFNDYSIFFHVIKHSKTKKRQRFEKFRDAYFKSDIRKHLFPKQEIINIKAGLGQGVIAKETIISNTYLGEYTGIVRKSIPRFDRSNRYLVRYPVKSSFFNYLVIDAKYHGNHTRFYNHSTKANAQLISVFCDGIFRMIVTSICKIENRSQILLDYGKLYWNQIKQTPNDFF
jgi:SET domain-containing protein